MLWGFGLPAKWTWQPPAPFSITRPLLLTAEPFHGTERISSPVPAKPRGKAAWPKCQLSNERVYLKNKQGTSLSVVGLSTPLCPPLAEWGEKISHWRKVGKGWLFNTAAQAIAVKLFALTPQLQPKLPGLWQLPGNIYTRGTRPL